MLSGAGPRRSSSAFACPAVSLVTAVRADHASYTSFTAASRVFSAARCLRQLPGACRLSLSKPGSSIRGLHPRVRLSLRGKPQLAAHLRRGYGLRPVAIQDPGLKLTTGRSPEKCLLIGDF